MTILTSPHISFHKNDVQEEQAGVELRNRYMNMMRSNSQERNSETRSIKATWVSSSVASCRLLDEFLARFEIGNDFWTAEHLNFLSSPFRTSVHPPIHQYHRPYSHHSQQTISKHESHDRHSVGQISENMEYNDDRKYSISGESHLVRLSSKFIFSSPPTSPVTWEAFVVTRVSFSLFLIKNILTQ